MRSPCENGLVHGKGKTAMHPIQGIILLSIFVTALVVVGMFCIHCLFEQGDGRLSKVSDEELIDKARKRAENGKKAVRDTKNMQ